MKTLKRSLSVSIFALLFVFLASFAVESSGSREFDEAVTVGSGAVSPHGFADSENRIHAVYVDGAGDSFYKRSSFPGDSYCSGAQAGGESAWHPRVSYSGGYEYVAYTYYDAVAGAYFPILFRGDDWGDEIFDGSVYGADYLGNNEPIHSDVRNVDSFVYVIADGKPVAGNNIFFWSNTDAYAGTSTLTSTSGARYPALAASGQNVYAVWIAGGEVRFSASGDNGGTWAVDDVEVSDLGSRGADGYRPGIAAAGGWVFIVWSDGGDIWFVYSNNNGAGLSDPVKIAAAGALQTQPSIGVHINSGAPHLSLAWRETSGGNPEIRFQEASRNGNGFVWGIDVNADGTVSGDEEGETIPVSGDAGDERAPKVAVSPAGVVYVLWEDSASGAMSARYLPDAASYSPEPPSNLTAEGGDLKVELSWTASTSPDVDSYRIYRSTMRGDAWGVPIAELGADAAGYTDDSVNNGIIYWYAATAMFGAEESGISNQANATPQAGGVDSTPPEPPSALRALPDSGAVSLIWVASSSADVDRYHIYARTDFLNAFAYAGAVPASGTEFSHAGLTDGVVYEYVVTAIDSRNNESRDSDSAWAAPGTADYGAGTPSVFSPGNPSGGTADAGPGSGSGCFVASAAFGGSSDAVMALSEFRDSVLSASRAGRAFVSGYYALSPRAAELAENFFPLKLIIRLHLFPVIRIIKELN